MGLYRPSPSRPPKKLSRVLSGDLPQEDRRLPPTCSTLDNAFVWLVKDSINRLEALKGELKGLHSIRINDQWRVVFRWEGGNAFNVHIMDYHK